MEQEWTRNDKWVDWKGDSFSALSEFQYATTPVPAVQPLGKEKRDVGHAGWSVADFRTKLNEQLQQQAQKLSVPVTEDMLLTPLEVVGLRLYTGK
jgi:hypothetical protein